MVPFEADLAGPEGKEARAGREVDGYGQARRSRTTQVRLRADLQASPDPVLLGGARRLATRRSGAGENHEVRDRVLCFAACWRRGGSNGVRYRRAGAEGRGRGPTAAL